MNWSWNVCAAVVVGLLAGSLVATSAGSATQYSTDQIVAGTPGSGSEMWTLPGVGPAMVDWQLWTNEAYGCASGSGAHTFLTVQRQDLEATWGPTRPLFVFLEGGNAGYRVPASGYPARPPTVPAYAAGAAYGIGSEEAPTVTGLLSTLRESAQRGTVITDRLQEGYRVLIVGTCDRDYFSGLGTPDAAHPTAEPVEGALAAMSAIDFVANLPDAPTSRVFVYGQSGGAIGAWTVSHALRELGIHVNGTILDSGVISVPFLQGLDHEVKVDHPEWRLPDWDTSRWQAKVGDYFEYDLVGPEPPSNPLFADAAVAAGFDVPVFAAYGTADTLCPDPCSDVWAPLHAAITGATEGIPHRIESYDAGHVVAGVPAFRSDLTEWLADVQASNAVTPWPYAALHDFTDVTVDPSIDRLRHDAVSWANHLGITQGYRLQSHASTCGGSSKLPCFLPDAALQRQQVSAFLYRMAGSPSFVPPSSPSFSDVSLTHPFRREIEWAADESITTGYLSSSQCAPTAAPCFKPTSSVTRQAVAAFAHRIAGAPSFTPPTSPTFNDVSASHVFRTEIEWMAARSIDAGFGAGDPGCATGRCYRSGIAETRAGVIEALYRLATAPAAWTASPPSTVTFGYQP